MSTTNIKELADILVTKRGASPVTILTHTLPTNFVGGKSCDILKAGPITKIQVVNGLCNFLYENSVNNQREREEQPTTPSGAVELFNAEQRRWGVRLVIGKYLLPFVHHFKGMVIPPNIRDIKLVKNLPHLDELYLELQCRQSGMIKYVQNDKELDYDEVSKYLREKNEGSRQQVDNPVVLRDFKLINIRQITLDQKVYELAIDND